jgi:hypothetical protein
MRPLIMLSFRLRGEVLYTDVAPSADRYASSSLVTELYSATLAAVHYTGIRGSASAPVCTACKLACQPIRMNAQAPTERAVRWAYCFQLLRYPQPGIIRVAGRTCYLTFTFFLSHPFFHPFFTSFLLRETFCFSFLITFASDALHIFFFARRHLL